MKDSKTKKNTSSLATNSWQLEKTLEKKRELQKVSLLNYQLLALHDNEKKLTFGEFDAIDLGLGHFDLDLCTFVIVSDLHQNETERRIAYLKQQFL